MRTFANSEAPDEMQNAKYTVCKGKNDLQTKLYNIFEKFDQTPLDMYNGFYCIKPIVKIH